MSEESMLVMPAGLVMPGRGNRGRIKMLCGYMPQFRLGRVAYGHMVQGKVGYQTVCQVSFGPPSKIRRESSMNENYQASKRLYREYGELAYILSVFGDELAKREKYKVHHDMDAVYFYLVQKYSWPIAQVRGMSYEDIRFVLAEEMSGWTLPPEARD